MNNRTCHDASRCARSLGRTGLAVAFVLGAAAPLKAQLEVNRLELQLRPTIARPITTTILVRNRDASATTAQIHIEDWDRLANGTNRFLPAGTVAGSCGPRLQAFPTTLSLAPGDSQAVRLTWTPDSSGVPAAECWAIVFIEQPPPPPRRGGSALAVQVRTGVKVYVTPPNLARSASIEQLALAPGADSGGRRKVSLRVRNEGAVHFEAKASLEIRRPDDTMVDSLGLPDLYALPGAAAEQEDRLPALPPGRYVLLLLVDYGAPDLLAGQLATEIR
jgi:P pilus assembly chaperone PapD